MNRVRWLATRLTLGVVVSALLVEVTLQLVAFVVFVGQDREPLPVPSGDHRVVLCVGDSNTFGAGASDPSRSYPSQLQVLLDQDDTLAWHVVNEGFPGRNSAELVHELPALLHQHEPDYVCVLIGTNNRWSTTRMDEPRPALDDPDLADPGGWKWRWRTGRVWQVARANLARDDAPAAALTPDVENLETNPHGIDGTPATPTGSGVTTGQVTSRQPVDAKASADQEQAATASKDAHGESPPSPTRVPTSDPELCAELRHAIDRFNEQDTASAREQLDGVLTRVRASDDRKVRELALHALLQQARYELTLEVGRESVERAGPHPGFYRALARAGSALHQHDEARAWIECALELKPQHALNWRVSANVAVIADRTVDACRDTLHAFGIDGDAAELQRQLQRINPERAVFEEAVQNISLTEHQQRVAQEAYALINNRMEHFGDRLTDDLRWAVGQIRAADATPILLTYASPVIQKYAGGSAAQVAGEFDLLLVDIAREMDSRLQGAEVAEYFVPDLHPNDAGYAVMARMVAEALTTR